jgi:PII-like signaling protein
MQGTQLTVYMATQSQRKHHMKSVEWILDEAARAGLHGATVIEVSETGDIHGRYHAARFIELADQPVAITVTGDDTRIDTLLDRLRQGGVPLFYTRCTVEYEVL